MSFPNEGAVFGAFTVESVQVEHVGAGAGRYEYPVEITVRGKGGKDGAKKALKPLLDRRTTIFSEFGNPYQCSIGSVQVEKLAPECYRLTARGLGVRVHLRPELLRFLGYMEQGLLVQRGDEERGRVVDAYLASYMSDTGKR